MSVAVYITVMSLTTYLIRMVPFTFFRRKIKSRFLNDFLSYIPYAVLTAITIPTIFYSTGSYLSAALGTAAALALAHFELPTLAVALAATVVAFAVSVT